MEKKRHILSCPRRQVGKRERKGERETELGRESGEGGKECERERRKRKEFEKIEEKIAFLTGLMLVQLAGQDSWWRLVRPALK